VSRSTPSSSPSHPRLLSAPRHRGSRATKKLTANENKLLKLLERWRAEAEKAGHKINRIAVTVRGGDVPAKTTALMPSCRRVRRLGALLPMRITASWSGSLARRIKGCGTIIRAPSRSSSRTSSSPHLHHRKCAVVLGAIKDKALRVALRDILDRSCARRRLDRVGRDEETGCPGRTKKLTMK
jgi:hypothetical protein